MRQQWQPYLLALSLTLGSTSNVLAKDPSLTTIDFPGADSTQIWGINPRGDIVGVYVSAGVTHGFLLSDGSFTTIDVPGAAISEVFGINPRGDIVGDYTVADGTHSFLLRDGSFTTFDAPDATRTSPGGINPRGEIVGLYVSSGVTHGFLLSRGNFTAIDAPDATTTLALGISPRGAIVGGFRSAGVGHAFLFSDGVFSSFDAPSAAFTVATGINAGGEMVGRYTDAGGVTHGYLRRLPNRVNRPTRGEDNEREFMTIHVPGAVFTDATAINPNSDVVGRYRGADGVSCANTIIPPFASGPHAVLWERDGSVHDLGNVGGTANAELPGNVNIAFSINNRGQVVGKSASGGNAGHAFLWTRETGMRDLGTLRGDVESAGLAINESGDVVGGSRDASGHSRPFLRRNGAMTNLNDLVPDSPLLLLVAFAINDVGEIAGFGVQTSSGELHAFLATPRHSH